MTEDEFLTVSRRWAATILDMAARLHLSPDETANLTGATMGEVLAHQLGKFGAVERLRMIADVFERDLLKTARLD